MPTKARNASIDIFRYIAALLVVSLHVTAFVDIHPMASYVFAQVLPRISVPFFFTVSGYYFTSRMEKKTVSPQKYITKLLITYALWSSLYYLLDFSIKHTIDFKQLLYSFFLSGSSYHFWFFPAIILSAVLTTVIFKLKCQKALIPISIVLYFIACLSNGYYAIGSRIPLLSSWITNGVFNDICNIFCFGFAYFICGYLIFKSESVMDRLQNPVKILLFVFSFFFFLGEVFALKILNLAENISVTLGLYGLIYLLVILLLSNPLPKLQPLSTTCRALANFTYYSHVMIITIAATCLKTFWNIQLPETIMFVGVVFVTFALGFVLSKINHPFVKSFLS